MARDNKYPEHFQLSVWCYDEMPRFRCHTDHKHDEMSLTFYLGHGIFTLSGDDEKLLYIASQIVENVAAHKERLAAQREQQTQGSLQAT